MNFEERRAQLNELVADNLVYPWLMNGVSKFKLTNPSLEDWTAYRARVKSAMETEIGPLLKELAHLDATTRFVSTDSREKIEAVNSEINATFLRLQSEGILPQELI